MNSSGRDSSVQAGNARDLLESNKQKLSVGIRVLLGFGAMSVLGAQITDLASDSRFRSVISFAIVALLLLGWRRNSLDIAAPKARPGILGRVAFPGYLLWLAALALIASFWLRSLSVASVASVLYFGWLLGRRCSPLAWSSIAPPWMMLFLICVSPFSWQLPKALQMLAFDSASYLLDRWGVLHEVDSNRLQLIGLHQPILLETNHWLSDYCFVGIVIAIVVISRQTFFQGLLSILGALLIAFLLPGVRIVVCSAIHTSGLAPGIFGSEHLLTGITFLTGLFLFVSCLCLLSFCLASVTCFQGESRSIGRLSMMWNRWVGFRASEIFSSTAKVSYAPKVDTARIDRSFFYRGMREYAASRSWAKLFGGLPILIAVAYLFLAFLSGSIDPRRSASQLVLAYAQPFAEFVKAKDFPKAKLLVQRLRQLEPFQSSYAYDLANALVSSGEIDEGENVIRQLIDINAQDTQAHAWLAKRCLIRGFSNPETIDLTQVHHVDIVEAERHLNVLLEIEPGNWQARAACVAILVSKSENAKAAKLLIQHQSKTEEDEIHVIRLMKQLQLHENAEQRARDLITRINSETPESVNLERTLILAEAQRASGNRWEAMETLAAAHHKFGEDPKICQSLVACGMEISRSLDPLLEADELLQCLRRIEAIDPESKDLAIFVSKIVFSFPDKSDQALPQYCREFLASAIQDGGLPDEAFVILGTGAAQRDKMDVALRYLQIGYDRGVRSSALLNNLAWVLSQQESPNLQLALDYVNKAIEADRSSYDAFLTRAEIWMHLGRYTDAIVDLEHVHLQGKELTHVRKRLADCYRAIGEPEIEAGLRNLLGKAIQTEGVSRSAGGAPYPQRTPETASK
jgi:tetratricopeptide (TPR) repeat protein